MQGKKALFQLAMKYKFEITKSLIKRETSFLKLQVVNKCCISYSQYITYYPDQSFCLTIILLLIKFSVV